MVDQSLRETFALMRADFAFRRALAPERPGWIVLLRMLTNPADCCVVRYRLQCCFFAHRLAPLGRLLRAMNARLYGVDLDERARIGGGFVIGRPIVIRIADGVTIGDRCVVHHLTTIVRSPFLEPDRPAGAPVVGHDVVFGMGSCAYGDIVIGDGCRIGANSVVGRSVPPRSILSGVPARIVGEATP